ncbi:symmetrical bis(5'-nucleosyl)-tetraphosphatase [Persicimonas caeni]|uniref:bis(5'-nucleosyl)-tetraphosphatase (symmetrical) n=1 Tax=Persicimonas caeni TaxID=2292766 RepID=A0A4Y6PXQ1_PERCE|nr:symmetrical bis(5'-nucleosyl)-tetraphosphatase [Persicimonas caeni]QDG53118.1 symmetrical bis(5'-nucleosyl)-tetraphosphatase [Persicimonas caeni]QED34340.1 symmetrical bis(5'-nucleosyl)-tetraphosphatase [Persicimonas caeni]
MATYAIGDIHGCFKTFGRLLERIEFDPAHDRLWLTGDLINGGPDPLATLRWVIDHDDVVTTVLGNHDLHMLAVAAGTREMRKKDNFEAIFEAEDRDDLLGWLHRQPLVRRADGYLMVHAALLPDWSAEQALALSGEVEAMLQGDSPGEFFEHMYGNKPTKWRDDWSGAERLRVIINAMTRLRVVEPKGGMAFDFSGPIEDLPEDRRPWFEADEPAWSDHTVIFGHWSALGVHKVGRVACLDSGCVWGGKLTAMRLDDEAIFQVTSEMPKRV